MHTLVSSALRDAAFASARYSRFADAARSDGDSSLAALFEGMAHVGLDEHFARLADLAELAGSDADNLMVAVQSENELAESTYPELSLRARTAGWLEAARLFDELGAEARDRARALESALEAEETPT